MLVLRSGLLAGALVLMLVTLGGCRDSQSESCPRKEQAFFKDSINRYFMTHDRSEQTDRFVFNAPAQYDDHDHWWIVPFDLNAESYEAQIECDGSVELRIE